MSKKLGILAALAAAFGVEKFATAQLADGTEIQYEGELAPGTLVTITVDGNQVPAPEGEHALGGDMEGKVIVLDATGTIVEVKDASAGDEGMSEEEQKFIAQIADTFKKQKDALVASVTALQKENADLKKNHNDLVEKFNKVVDEVNRSKSDKDKFKRAEKVNHTSKLA